MKFYNQHVNQTNNVVQLVISLLGTTIFTLRGDGQVWVNTGVSFADFYGSCGLQPGVSKTTSSIRAPLPLIIRTLLTWSSTPTGIASAWCQETPHSKKRSNA